MVFSTSSLHPQPDVNDNKIPEVELPVRPTVNEVEIVQKSNEIPLQSNDPEASEDYPSNVLMSHASDDSILNKTEVLAGQYASRRELAAGFLKSHENTQQAFDSSLEM